MKSRFNPLPLVALVAAAFSPAALACSSCGCTLTSDWGSQGYSGAAGFHMDLRFDYFNQDQLRTGTTTVDRGSISFPTNREIQQETINRNTTLSLDYNAAGPWGVRVSVPYFDRYHTTIVDPDTAVSTSHTKSVGDVRVLGRYHGLSDDHTFGLQFGLKLATGSIHNNFINGPQDGQPLDRGLQPGTGTTDLLYGAYKFGAINKDWDYFAQGLVQQPLNSKEDFKPGIGINLNLGMRYVGFEKFIPQIQFNVRGEKRDSGANADVENSGATLVYLSPGVTVSLTEKAKIYGFVQVPVYQRVNGYQIEPRYSGTIGLYFSL
jgi:hypothetical protein